MSRSLRLLRRRLRQVTCRPTGASKDETGGSAILEQPSSYHFSFSGVLLAPQRRVTRTPGGVRLATTWLLIPLGRPDVKEMDNLQVSGFSRLLVVTAVRDFPRHLEYTLEILP